MYNIRVNQPTTVTSMRTTRRSLLAAEAAAAAAAAAAGKGADDGGDGDVTTPAVSNKEEEQDRQQKKSKDHDAHENDENENDDNAHDDNDNDNDNAEQDQVFRFKDQTFVSYQDMVEAKREYNVKKMTDIGLMGAVEGARLAAAVAQHAKKRAASTNGLQKRKSAAGEAPGRPRPRASIRTSNRLKGVKADNKYIASESGGGRRRTVTVGKDGTHLYDGSSHKRHRAGNGKGMTVKEESDDEDDNDEDDNDPPNTFYRDRVCDAGVSLSVEGAIHLAHDRDPSNRFSKWVGTSADDAKAFLIELSRSNKTRLKMKKESGIVMKQEIKAKEEEQDDSNSNPSKSSPKSVSVTVVKEEQQQEITNVGSSSSSSTIFQTPCASRQGWVAKVTPDRIYSIACHPCPDRILVAAGDKQGYLGLWNVNVNVNATSASASDTDANNAHDDHGNNNVHLFRPHSRVINHLEWNANGSALYSVSYDSTVRRMDVETQTFAEVFAAYDDSSPTTYKQYAGYNIDQGHRFWTQSGTLLPGANDNGMWLCTSTGDILQLDLRCRTQSRLVQHVKVSDKKVNTISGHPDGNLIATAGLDTTVKLWDVRKFCNSSTKSRQDNMATPWTPTKASKAMLAEIQCGKSVNSAYFSPQLSGNNHASKSQLLVTKMSDAIDIYNTNDLVLLNSKGSTTPSSPTPVQRIPHNNQTGRWLCTFMAQWHGGSSGSAESNSFIVGSMARPRRMDLFTSNTTSSSTRENAADSCASTTFQRHEVVGEYMSSICSRCCFHPASNNSSSLIVCGGNSSGRVTVAR
jgi:WD40 repeat protein